MCYVARFCIYAWGPKDPVSIFLDSQELLFES
jgi:hypothetical protein